MRRTASPQKKARANRRGQSHMRFDHRTNLKGDRSGWCADRAAASNGRLVPRWRNLKCESLQLSLQFVANCVSIIPHMLQLAQDHADMLLCKVAGAVTRKGYLYMVFLKLPVPRLLPSQLVEPVSPQPRGKRLYGNFLWHVHITALSRSRRRASTCPRFAAAQSQQRRAPPQRPPLAGRS